VRWQKQDNGGKYWVAHIVFFVVQYAGAEICRHFLVRGLQSGVNGVNMTLKTRKATGGDLSIFSILIY